MSTRTCRVGIHGRNDHVYHGIDYDVIQMAQAEVI